MKNKIFNKIFFITIGLSLMSFSINYYVASRGVFPVDTFIHFDPGYRILGGELPVRDYWIVHGFLIDYIQSIFFLLFGNNWSAYIIHSSFFNSLICIASFYIFKNFLKIGLKESIYFSILIAFSAYPVSGTPFLDLHSTYFSLFAIFFIMVGILKKEKTYWLSSSVLLTIAFFCKQVPAGYTIFTTTIFCLIYSIYYKNFKIFLYFCLGGLFASLTIILFLQVQGIRISDFILQLFLFPKSFGENRYIEYKLNFNNLFLDFKFIYLLIIINLSLIIFSFKKNKKLINFEKINVFLIFLLFTLSSIFHQVYTKNQIYIFFLIPLLGGFVFYFLNGLELKNKKKLKLFIILFCLATTIKYVDRFSLDRKFHELNNTNINNTYNFVNFDEKFDGLKWISPHFNNPKDEIKKIIFLKKILEKEKQKTMLLTEYQFYSLLLNKKLFNPTRTYDNISFPKKNSIYYDNYKNFLKKIINKNDIISIFIFENKEITKQRLNHLIFNYIPEECFNKINIQKEIIKLEIKNCEDLK